MLGKMALRSVTVFVQVCLVAQSWLVTLMMMMPGTADVQILSIAVTKVFSNLHGLNLHGLDRRRRNYHPGININFYEGTLDSASASTWRNLWGNGFCQVHLTWKNFCHTAILPSKHRFWEKRSQALFMQCLGGCVPEGFLAHPEITASRNSALKKKIQDFFFGFFFPGGSLRGA